MLFWLPSHISQCILLYQNLSYINRMNNKIHDNYKLFSTITLLYCILMLCICIQFCSIFLLIFICQSFFSSKKVWLIQSTGHEFGYQPAISLAATRNQALKLRKYMTLPTISNSVPTITNQRILVGYQSNKLQWRNE